MVTTALSYTDARKKLASIIRTCVDDCVPVGIYSRQREVVVVSREEYDSWMETLHQLDTPANVAHLEKSERQIRNGETVRMTPEELQKFMLRP